MSANRVQVQPGISLPQFMEVYCTEEKGEAALDQVRWPNVFICPRCGEKEHGLGYGRCLKRYQCGYICHQATLTDGTMVVVTKLPLTTWFLPFYLIGQAKTGHFLARTSEAACCVLPNSLADPQQNDAANV